jgi:magnesium chelatase accessory protein
VISVDLPGHAFTRGAVNDDLTLPGMARALIALQAALSAEEQPGPASSATAGGAPARADIWIGHSAGAAVALQVMLLQPSVVREVISLNGALLPWGGRAASLFMPVARALATNPWTTRFFVWNARRPGTVDLLLRDTGSVIDERGHRLYERLAHNELHLRAVLRMMAQWELEPFARELPRLQGRVTLISSAQDGTVPPSISARAAALIPGSKLIALPRWGHLGHEEAPAEWASLVLQALAP